MAAFLPSIKCSNCNVDIEISKMGDHVCSGPPPTSADPEPWLDRRRAPSPEPMNPYEATPYRSGRAPPSRIDPSAANRPYMRSNTLAPSTFSSSQNEPYSASHDARNAPFRQTNRSATSPLPKHTAAPSIELSNLDCAFPPFPTSPATARRPGAGPLTPPFQHDTHGDYDLDESDPRCKPSSPKSKGGGNVLQRMNTIVPGPFGVGGRRDGDQGSGASDAGRMGHQRTMTSSSTKDYMVPPSATASSFSESFKKSSNHNREPSEATSELRDAARKALRRAPTLANGTMASRPTTPKADHFRKASIASEATDASYESFRKENRSQTHPQTGLNHDMGDYSSTSMARRPSEPFNAERRPTFASVSETGSDLSTTFRTSSKKSKENPSSGRSRKDSRAGLDREQNSNKAPPLPSFTQQHHVPRLQHTPTESQSSNGSGYGSEARTGSSRSTPPLPEASDKSLRRHQSSPGSTDKPLPSRPKNAPSNGTRHQHGGSKSSSKPGVDFNGYGGFGNPYQDLVARRPSPELEDEPPPVRRPTTANKGSCRGCKELIRGKSVCSADGRLTGRYHKRCFVCQTCRAPFETATFYVIQNQPYCERHYHQLNDSICQSCDQGIEGQYLATEEQQKFHPGCFKCSDCRKTLRDEYFEMNGKAYCEVHANRRADKSSPLGPGRRNPERRRTRMMMI